MAGIIELDSALELLHVARRSEVVQAMATANIFQDTVLGLASGAPYFSVPSAEVDEYLVLYRNDAGAAVVVDTYPNVAGLNNARDAAEAYAADVLSVAQEVSADRLASQLAADAAQLSAGVYATTAAGLLATAAGRYFSVPSADSGEYLILYQNNAGVAAVISRYPSVLALDKIQSRMEDATIPGIAWMVSDTKGAAPLRITTDGVTEAESLKAEQISLPGGESFNTSSVPGVPVGFFDAAGNSPWAIKADGTNVVAALEAGSALVKGTAEVDTLSADIMSLKTGEALKAMGFQGIAMAFMDQFYNCPWLIKDDGTSGFAAIETKALSIGGVDILERLKASSVARSTDMVMGPSGLVPLYADMAKISGWGSSSLNFLASQITSIFATVAPGATYYNGAQGGETARSIAGRLGAIPMLISVPGGSLAASGATTVTCSNVAPNWMMRSFTGSLAGVYGTLSSDGTSFTFTRTTAGSAVGVSSDTPFLPDVGPQYRNGVALLWMGKNDIGSPDTSAEIAGRTDASFDYFTPYVKRILVLGHFGNPDWVGGATLVPKMLQINALHSARYGANYIDVLSYLESPAVWTDTGISPTSTDLAAQAGHCLPPSLTDDGIHFNAPLNVAFAAFLKTKLTNLGWY